MISCYRATELIEKSQAVGLNPFDKLKLRLHTSVCDMCKKYQTQSEMLDQALLTKKDLAPDQSMEELEDEIVKRMKEEKPE